MSPDCTTVSFVILCQVVVCTMLFVQRIKYFDNFNPIMLAYAPMLEVTYYAPNYASIIRQCLMVCQAMTSKEVQKNTLSSL